MNGPFPCGSYPEIKIFKREIVHPGPQNALIVGDNGYMNAKYINASNLSEGS